MSDAACRIALIHAVQVAMEPVERAFEESWPRAECMNLLEDSLSRDRLRDGRLTDAMAGRIAALCDYAVEAGANGILFTCSAFGPAIEQAARTACVPVLKPNQAMFDEALREGGRVGMLATFGPSVDSMEDEFRAAAKAAGSDARIETILVEGAMAALKAGDEATHNRLLAEAAPGLRHCDQIMLAHFSTSVARRAVETALDRAVLTAPHAAVAALRTAVAGN